MITLTTNSSNGINIFNKRLSTLNFKVKKIIILFQKVALNTKHDAHLFSLGVKNNI